MITFLIDPLKKEPVASVEQHGDKKNLNILDENFRKILSVNGITLSSKQNGCWRVYPDGDPDIFLKALENDLFNHGLKQKGFYWISEEEYANYDQKVLDMVSLVLGKLI